MQASAIRPSGNGRKSVRWRTIRSTIPTRTTHPIQSVEGWRSGESDKRARSSGINHHARGGAMVTVAAVRRHKLCLAGSPLQLELLVAAGFMPIATGRTSLPKVSFDSACQWTLETLSVRNGNERGLALGGAADRPDLAVWSDSAD